MYRRTKRPAVLSLRAGSSSRRPPLLAAVGAVLPLGRAATNLALTSPLVWIMVAISAAGSIVTFAFLVYALVRFRDPSVRRRRFG